MQRRVVATWTDDTADPIVVTGGRIAISNLLSTSNTRNSTRLGADKWQCMVYEARETAVRPCVANVQEECLRQEITKKKMQPTPEKECKKRGVSLLAREGRKQTALYAFVMFFAPLLVAVIYSTL